MTGFEYLLEEGVVVAGGRGGGCEGGNYESLVSIKAGSPGDEMELSWGNVCFWLTQKQRSHADSHTQKHVAVTM